jgi:hypothetical protein
MSSARELVEHQYSEGGLLFPWLTNKRKLKVLERDLRPMYFTAVLMRSCYTCMYLDNTSARMGVEPVEMPEYLSLA